MNKKSYCYRDHYAWIDSETPRFNEGELYECNFYDKDNVFVHDKVSQLNGHNTWTQFTLVRMIGKTYFYDYFYSEQEFRNFKLKKLNSIC